MDAKTISRHIEQRNFVKISRLLTGNKEDIRGFILARSASLLLVQLTYDFMFDGYVIIRQADIDSIRCSKFERTSKRIFKGEGSLDSFFGFSDKISLKDWQSVFIDLKRLDYHVIVECEDKEEPDFIIGPVRRLTSSGVSIQYYDPTGKLNTKLSRVSFPDITIVWFGDNYSTVFRKYLVAPNLKRSKPTKVNQPTKPTLIKHPVN